MTMRILLVEDDDAKAADVASELRNYECDVERSKSATSARAALASKQFDLVILDVVLPNFDDGHAKETYGVDLLRELHESAYLKRPRYIIGLTGYLDLTPETEAVFSEMLWTLVSFDRGTGQWKAALRMIINHISETNLGGKGQDYLTDLCVMTALKDPEFTELLNLEWEWSAPEPLDHQSFIRRGEVEAANERLSVVAAHAPRMGMVPTALLAAQLIHKYRPRLIAMVGICAGLRGKVELGQVICASVSWDWQSGKHVSDGTHSTFQFDPDFISGSGAVSSRIDLISDAERLSIFSGNGKEIPALIPKIVNAPMATGSAVLSDAAIVEKIILQNRKVLSFDMECYGLYNAAFRASLPAPNFICIKGIADFGDESKTDDIQRLCAKNSARVLQFLIAKHGRQLFPG